MRLRTVFTFCFSIDSPDFHSINVYMIDAHQINREEYGGITCYMPRILDPIDLLEIHLLDAFFVFPLLN